MSDVRDLRPEEAETPSPNGHEPGSVEAQLLALLDGTIREKRDAVLALEAERDRISKAILHARAAAKAYEDMRKRALGEPLRSGRLPGSAKPGPKSKADGKPRGTRVSPERIEGVKADILRYIEANGDEFSQVDIRSMPDATITHSGAIAFVFEALRQEGFIRFARKAGVRQMFRLTRSAVAQ